ncbi:MAG: PQQ-binding-like beta-propeller repeat protein, partial [Gemmatimonadetes bacterium]|nr:PQQ-binding-like beta-propeller repeat protein [Gemmatimonadota bacterium]
MSRLLRPTILSLALLTLLGSFVESSANWPYWASDAASTRYVPFDQIHRGNVDSLRILWRYRLPDAQIVADEQDFEAARYKGTPLVIDGVLYTVTPFGVALALDATTGEELWRFDTMGRYDDSTGQYLNRGVGYWSDEDGNTRILFGTWSDTLYSLDAKTGLPDPAFGDQGRVDLTQGLRASVIKDRFGLASPPTIVGDVAIVGSIILDWHNGESPFHYVSPGDVRGYDVRTGEQLWRFHTIPQPGEIGWDQWEGTSWSHLGAANVWGTISADPELGYAYLPVSSVSHDRYGGERPGENVFSDCLVAVDARTGEYVWHYQLIHHTLWNYDPPAAPILLDVTIDGEPRKIVVQVTKQSYAYVFDRITGEPIWPIVERPAPASDVEGEFASPTQPHPTRPAAYDRQGFTEDDLINFTPELRQQALEEIGERRTGPLYTPPSLEGSVQMPGELGGADWVGGAVDPTTGVLYIGSKTRPDATILLPVEDPDAFSVFGGRAQFFGSLDGLPLTTPPYGRFTAIDMNTGEHLWMRTMGTGPVNHPALANVGDLPETLGWAARSFPLVTPDLLFVTMEDPRSFNPVEGPYFVQRDASLFALDKTTGSQIAELPLPDNTYGGLFSYMAEGRQYIAATIGGDKQPAEIVVVGVPRSGDDLPPEAWAGYPAEHPAFEEAVARIDAGDAAGLDSLLRAAPGLVNAAGYDHDLFPLPQLRGARLVHVLTGSDRAPLPANVVELASILYSHGADASALTADSTGVLQLLLTSSQLLWIEGGEDLIGMALDGGAEVGAETMWNALVGEPHWFDGLSANHFNMARILARGGVEVDLPFTAALGDTAALAAFFDAEGALLPSANTQFRPKMPEDVSDQHLLDLSLSYAAYAGNVEAIDWLLDRGAAIDSQPHGFFDGNAAQRGGVGALHKAIYSDQLASIRRLLERGADIALVDENFNSPPIFWANILGRKGALAVLQEFMGEPEGPAEEGDEPYMAKMLTEVGGFPQGIEGPAVDAGGLLYAVNFEKQGTVGVVDADGSASLFVELPQGSIGNGIRFNRAGDMLIADYTRHNVLRVDMETQEISVFAHEAEMNQPNDIAIASDDALYASDPNWGESTGQLWRISPEGVVERLASGMGTTNGVEVSPDETRLYVNESMQRKVWVFDLSPEGQINNKRLLIEFEDGGMDGMRCDVEGNLYITRHGSGKVVKVSPAGEVLLEIELTGQQPSNIAFGGVDGRTAF